MGKARIIGGGSEGLYDIRREYDTARYDEMVATLNQQIATINESLIDINARLDQLESERDAAIAAAEAAIDAYAATEGGPGEEFDALAAAQIEVARTAAAYEADRWPKVAAELALTTAQRRLTEINAVATPGVTQAWCADLTEDAEGVVATIEIPGEPTAPLLIRPQYPDDSAHSHVTHGTLHPRVWMTPEQAYFNAAILPGWQKFKPTYRAATITSIDQAKEECSVALDPSDSSAQGLNVNQTETLDHVPITYMTCDASAFDVSDRVVVEFECQDWARPRVIGFLHNPRACALGRMVWMPEGFWLNPRGDGASDGWGLPRDEEGQPTPGGPIRQVLVNKQIKANYPDRYASSIFPESLFFLDAEDDADGPRGSRIGIAQAGAEVVPQFDPRWTEQLREADSDAWHWHWPETIRGYGSATLDVIFDAVNTLRETLGLPPLMRPLRGVYNADADTVLREMVAAGVQAHSSDDYAAGYRTFPERVQRSGWVHLTAGENLAMSSPGTAEPAELGAAIVDGWVNSPYHYDNLVREWADPAQEDQAAFMLLAAGDNTITGFESELGAELVPLDPPLSGLSVAQVFHGTPLWLSAYAAVYQGDHGTVSWFATHNNRYFTYRVQRIWETNARMQAYRRFSFKGRISEPIPWSGDLDVRGIVGVGIAEVSEEIRFRVAAVYRTMALSGEVTAMLELWDVPGDGRMAEAQKVAEIGTIFNVTAVQRALFSKDGTKCVVGVHRAVLGSGLGIRQDQVNFNERTGVTNYYGSELLWYEFDGTDWALRSTEAMNVAVVEAKTESIGVGAYRNTFEQECKGTYKWLADYNDAGTLVYAQAHVDMHLLQTADHDHADDFLETWNDVDINVSATSSAVSCEIKIVWPDLSEFVATDTTSVNWSMSGHNNNIIDLDIRDPSKMTYVRLDLSCPENTLDMTAGLTLIRDGETIKSLENSLPPTMPALPALWQKGCAWGGGILEMYPTRLIFEVSNQQPYWFGHWPIGTSMATGVRNRFTPTSGTPEFYGNTRMIQSARLETDTIGGSRWAYDGVDNRPQWVTHTRAAPSIVQNADLSSLTVCEYNGEYILSGLFRNCWGPEGYGFGWTVPAERHLWRSSLDLNAISGKNLGTNIGPISVI